MATLAGINLGFNCVFESEFSEDMTKYTILQSLNGHQFIQVYAKKSGLKIVLRCEHITYANLNALKSIGDTVLSLILGNKQYRVLFDKTGQFIEATPVIELNNYDDDSLFNAKLNLITV